jgi:prephenate dehydrogenase
MKTLGIIGYGSFGALVANVLGQMMDVKVVSRSMEKVPEAVRSTMAEVAACDYLVLSVPLGSYRKVLADVAEHIGPDTVLVDICSVKVIPCQIIQELLPDTKLVATHPLFGPQTASEGFKDHVMVICDDKSDAEQAEKFAAFCTELGMDVVRMTADEHDRQMAKVHALTFFIARGLFGMDREGIVLKTPSYKRLESLIELEHHHSDDLFETIQLGNPHAEAVRQGFVHDIDALARSIQDAAARKEF